MRLDKQQKVRFKNLMAKLHEIKTDEELAVEFKVCRETIYLWRIGRHSCEEIEQFTKVQLYSRDVRDKFLNKEEKKELVSNLWYIYLYADSPRMISHKKEFYFEGASSWRYIASLIGITIRRINKYIYNGAGNRNLLLRTREIIKDLDRPKDYYETQPQSH